MDNINDKKWWQSKTVWGGLVALGAGIAGVLGLAIGAADQAILTESLTAIAAAVGGLLAVYGRFKANQAIK
ncbi:MAG: hypothetical protein IBX55_19970 [Methyloprofundus sp.]|nr:hypothetical protein [Methyloprofundus sp.]